jgi:shikimate kinase
MREYDNIVLIGMPGVGKSTAGVIAAKTLGLKFEDTDLMIQSAEKRLLKQIISDEGVTGFLKIEENVLKSIDQKGYLIATGGSAVYGFEGMDHLRENSLIIYLHLELDELTKRLGNLENRGVVLKPGQTLADIYEERLPLYRRFADIEIDETNLDIEATVTKICSGVSIYNCSQNTGLTNS